MRRSRVLLTIFLLMLAACRQHPPPPLPTPVPRTSVPLSPRAITAETAGDVQLLTCLEGVAGELAWSLDGSLLAILSQGVGLYDGHSFELVRRLESGDYFLADAFSPDGTLVAGGTDNGKLWVWRVADGGVEQVMQGWSLSRLWAVAFSPDGATVIASDLKPRVYVWRVADGTLVRSFEGEMPENHGPTVPTAATLSPDGALLALKEGGKIRLWRTDDGSLLRSLTIEGWDTSSLDFSGDGRFLMASGGGQLVVWEREEADLALVSTISGGDDSCCAALSPDGSMLATGGSYDTVLLLHMEDGARLWTQETKHGDWDLRGLSFSPDGSRLATSGGGVTCLWGLAPKEA